MIPGIMDPSLMQGAAWLWMAPLIIWDMIWKGIALWKSGRNNQLYWFIALFLLNTAGILPIIYVWFFQKKETTIAAVKKKKKR